MARQSILLLSDRPGWPDRVLAWRDHFNAERCTSPEEARALLQGSRPWDAVLMDGSHPGVDRDLIALAARAGTRSLVVDAVRPAIDWALLGATAALPPHFTVDDLVSALSRETPAHSVGRLEHASLCVTGPGGTGASTVAIALSQGLATRMYRVLLADFRRHAELHVLHHLEADRPGIGELVEAHRTSSPEPAALFDLATAVARGYRVLPGLRRAVGWSSLRPRALEAALSNLRSAYEVVVCDVDPDLEGEEEGGSFDVEERNALSRTAVASSAGVLVVGGPGAKGAHSLLRVLGEIWAHGVAPQQTVAVVNRGDQLSVNRLGEALARLGAADAPRLFLPDLPLEPVLLSDSPLPDELVTPITDTALPLLELAVTARSASPERISPGSLGVAKRGPEGA